MSNQYTVVPVQGLAGQPTIASLQASMLQFSDVVSEGNRAATTDYRLLQAAILAGNLSLAQVALARLQQDSRVIGTNGNTAAAAEAASAAAPPSPSAPSAPSGSLDVVA